MKNISRRTAIKTVLAGSAAMAVSGMEAAAPAKEEESGETGAAERQYPPFCK